MFLGDSKMFLVLTKQFAKSMMPLALLALIFASVISCETEFQDSKKKSSSPLAGKTAKSYDTSAQDGYAENREQMVARHMIARDIVDPRVLDVMKRVPRHKFVPAAMVHRAYDDSPLPIGHQQTISQPYIVALMTQLIEPKPNKKALDIGTGSGYQAAVLAELVKSVHSIEIVEPLATEARDRLKSMGYENITVKHGDGYQGWNSEAPFDIIVVAAAPDHVPQPLVDQLAPNGKMVIPVGRYYQKLLVIEKRSDGSVVEKNVIPVSFVPMTGEAQQKK